MKNRIQKIGLLLALLASTSYAYRVVNIKVVNTPAVPLLSSLIAPAAQSGISDPVTFPELYSLHLQTYAARLSVLDVGTGYIFQAQGEPAYGAMEFQTDPRRLGALKLVHTVAGVETIYNSVSASGVHMVSIDKTAFAASTFSSVKVYVWEKGTDYSDLSKALFTTEVSLFFD